MTYSVKEIFYTLQGEGVNTGRPAVFCRFSGCNLWSGRESDRAKALCQFCDTDFVGVDGLGGGHFSNPGELVDAILSFWPLISQDYAKPLVVFTGGEPLLQLDSSITSLLHEHGFEVAIETNGTLIPPEGVDWICMSPKMGTNVVLREGQELKLVFPQKGLDPLIYEKFDFEYFFIQPMDGLEKVINTKLAVEFCLKNPKWRLSLQTQKLLALR